MRCQNITNFHFTGGEMCSSESGVVTPLDENIMPHMPRITECQNYKGSQIISGLALLVSVQISQKLMIQRTHDGSF